MIGNIAVALAFFVSFFALGFSIWALFVQKKSVRATIFHSIFDRIRDLENQWPDCKKDIQKEQWYERLFSAFEYFAFYANRKGIIPSFAQAGFMSGL